MNLNLLCPSLLANNRYGDIFRQLPDVQGSTMAEGIDFTYYFIYWISVFFLVLVTVVMIYFVIRYRRRDEDEPFPQGPTHNTALELTWTVIPLILVLFMFYYGMDSYVALATPPQDSYRVDVRASKWKWEYQYLNGAVGGVLHTYVGQPFALRMTSSDVLHSWYCPSMRVKRDVVPGRTDTLWFEPTPQAVGEHIVYCAEYCGTEHSLMRSRLIVHATPEAWQAAITEMDTPKGNVPWEKGYFLAIRKGCMSCHTLDGSELPQYPKWLDLSNSWGQTREFEDGGSAIIDDAYVAESIKVPGQHIVKGYENVMARNTFKSDEEINWIVDFLRGLKDTKPQEFERLRAEWKL